MGTEVVELSIVSKRESGYDEREAVQQERTKDFVRESTHGEHKCEKSHVYHRVQKVGLPELLEGESIIDIFKKRGMDPNVLLIWPTSYYL